MCINSIQVLKGKQYDLVPGCIECFILMDNPEVIAMAQVTLSKILLNHAKIHLFINI